MQTPFSCVTFFNADAGEEVSSEYDYQQFNELLDKCIPSKNMLYSIRINGLFKYVRTRSVPKQAEK
jgi:acetolactate decarboxylase